MKCPDWLPGSRRQQYLPGKAALSCLNKIQEVQNSICGTANALASEAMAKTVVKMLKSNKAELEKQRIKVQKLATAAQLDTKAVNDSINEAVASVTAAIATLKSAHRFLPGC